MESKRILLIEDNRDIQVFVSTAVRMEGAELVVADSGEAGLTSYREEGRFDLILLDLGLPGISGWDVLQSIRQRDGARAGVPVVIFTANAEPGTFQRAVELGAKDVIVKPVSARDLIRRLSAALS
jgi:CheY-like chemotaxis protein